MIPTIKVGDFILVNKFAYGLRLPVLGTKILDVAEPQRGEIMVFIPPHVDQYYIKRVIGLPGDTIRYENQRLFVNGEIIPEEFVANIKVILVSGLSTAYSTLRPITVLHMRRSIYLALILLGGAQAG